MAHCGGVGIFGRKFQELAQMIRLGSAVALGLVDFGEKKIDLSFQRVVPLISGELSVLFCRVKLVEIKIRQAVVVKSGRRFGGVSVDDLIGEIGHLCPVFLFGRNICKAKIRRIAKIAIIAGIAKIEKPTPTPLKHGVSGVSGGMKIARYRAESHVRAVIGKATPTTEARRHGELPKLP